MEINNIDIERIVRQVLNNMNTPVQSTTADTATGSKGRVAMLTAKQTFEIKSYDIPNVGDDELLVRVEGCGVCGTDLHEYKNDPFGLIPVVLGHEGSGVIVKMGRNIAADSAGNPVKLGDRIVTSVIVDEDKNIAMFDMNKANLSEHSDVYGLLPDDDIHFNGWFSDYLLIRKGSSFFVVNDLSLDLRLLVEPAAVVIHAVERAKTTGLLRFNSRVAVQGCGPIGLLLTAVVRTMGVEHIVAIDGNEARLNMAQKMGATHTIDFTKYADSHSLTEAVKNATDGRLADFAFQCTGSPAAHANVWKFVRRGGGLCELGFFVDNGNATINPHYDICNKEITVVGSWVYTLRDYVTTFDFLKRAKQIGIPLESLITHRFPLSQIDEALKVNMRMEGLKVAYINESVNNHA